MTRSVAGRRIEPDAPVDGMVDGNEVDDARLAQGRDRVAEVVVAVGERGRLPVLELGLCEQVAPAREGRHPLAVDERRVPAHVVDVQVRAHHRVDRVSGKACRLEVGEEREVQLVPPGVRSGLVVADARVDRDPHAVEVDDEALDPLEEVAAVVDERALEPRRSSCDVEHARLVEVFEEEARRRHRLDLDDRRDGGSAHSPCSHRAILPHARLHQSIAMLSARRSAPVVVRAPH